MPFSVTIPCFRCQEQGKGTLKLSSHASPHSGPQGPLLSEAKFQPLQYVQKTKNWLNRRCDEYQTQESDDYHMSVLFPSPVPLVPLVYYHLELWISTTSRSEVIIKEETDEMKKYELFGRPSPPVRKIDESELLEKPLRWFEMKGEGLQPVGNQLPVIFYVP